MKFELWRILGNDLPPRHSDTQTEDNLKFILQKENQFQNCTKLFLLNRIVDQEKQNKYQSLITEAGFEYKTIPFNKDEFLALDTVYARLHYTTNVNAARNFCVSHSLSRGADVVCPMDGGMFYTDSGWANFSAVANEHPDDGFFAFPTWRLSTYDDVLRTRVMPQFKSAYIFGETQAIGMTELQLALTKNHDQNFDESLMYGRADKVELLYRLGLLGLWDKWAPELRKEALKKPSKFFGKVTIVSPGYVCRLPSGNAGADHNNELRGAQRFEGMNKLMTLAGG